jgi:hypothetical protein
LTEKFPGVRLHTRSAIRNSEAKFQEIAVLQVGTNWYPSSDRPEEHLPTVAQDFGH